MEKTIFIFFVFVVVGAGFAALPVIVSWLLSVRKKETAPPKELVPPESPDEIPWATTESLQKLQEEPYESGMPSAGPWRYVGFEYFLYAILFLVFDIIFVALFFALGAWLAFPKNVLGVLIVIAILSIILIAYALKPRKYLSL